MEAEAKSGGLTIICLLSCTSRVSSLCIFHQYTATLYGLERLRGQEGTMNWVGAGAAAGAVTSLITGRKAAGDKKREGLRACFAVCAFCVWSSLCFRWPKQFNVVIHWHLYLKRSSLIPLSSFSRFTAHTLTHSWPKANGPGSRLFWRRGFGGRERVRHNRNFHHGIQGQASQAAVWAADDATCLGREQGAGEIK